MATSMCNMDKRGFGKSELMHKDESKIGQNCIKCCFPAMLFMLSMLTMLAVCLTQNSVPYKIVFFCQSKTYIHYCSGFWLHNHIRTDPPRKEVGLCFWNWSIPSILVPSNGGFFSPLGAAVCIFTCSWLPGSLPLVGDPQGVWVLDLPQGCKNIQIHISPLIFLRNFLVDFVLFHWPK